MGKCVVVMFLGGLGCPPSNCAPVPSLQSFGRLKMVRIGECYLSLALVILNIFTSEFANEPRISAHFACVEHKHRG